MADGVIKLSQYSNKDKNIENVLKSKYPIQCNMRQKICNVFGKGLAFVKIMLV